MSGKDTALGEHQEECSGQHHREIDAEGERGHENFSGV